MLRPCYGTSLAQCAVHREANPRGSATDKRCPEVKIIFEDG
jgi:hypothetical protein